MHHIESLKSRNNFPRLIPTFKQTERRLLSVFMSLLDIVPEFRGKFLHRCGFRSGKNCSYFSIMEAEYNSPKLPHVRPDGLINCKRGSSEWSAFIEAKAEKSDIRIEQMQDYCGLAHQLDVPAIISISNEFAKTPTELPYHLANNKRKKRDVFHFSWAELRTFIAIFAEKNTKITATERALITQCLEFMWSKESGILTFDSMPKDWSKFVESSGTALGFSTTTAGVTEIIYGWQQERRDLFAKLLLKTHMAIELRHEAGSRASADECLKFDRKNLANDYTLTTSYLFKGTKAVMRVHNDLRSCKTSVALEFAPPTGKKAKATTTWLAKSLSDQSTTGLIVSFDWAGSQVSATLPVDEFLANPDLRVKIRKAHQRKFASFRRFRMCADSRVELVSLRIWKDWLSMSQPSL